MRGSVETAVPEEKRFPLPPALEKTRRAGLNMFDEAEEIKKFVESTGATQETVARLMGCSQSYVANKLRLLRLPTEDRRSILVSGLTERHARAIIRIPDEKTRAEAILEIVARRMNVAAAEDYVESVLCAAVPLPEPDPSALPSRQPGKIEVEFKRRLLLRDMRLFYNSIDHAVESVRSCGFSVLSTRTRTPDGVRIDIFIKNERPENCFT